MNKLKISGCRLTVILIASLVFVGCAPYKKIPYFQDVNKSAGSKENITNFSEVTIGSGDILGINVVSLNPEASAIFNYNLNRVTGNNYDMSPTNAVTGYLVDSLGQIQIPYIGAFKVGGQTLDAVRTNLQNALVTYLKNPIVNIRLLNFNVSVLGDVLRPDIYSSPNGRFTITEALSKAGDLNITAKRSNVLLIRENAGVREYIPIDMTSKNLFKSPYFYLRNNDVLYVTPGKTKYATVDRSYRTGSLILTGLSILAIVITNVYN